MERKIALQLLAVAMLCALMPFLLAPYNAEPVKSSYKAPTNGSTWDSTGPYTDYVVFKVISGTDVQVAALRTGEIDLLGDMLDDPAILAELEADPNVDVDQTPRLGFGHLTMNCQLYPYVYPELRRAINYALDKYEFAAVMWGGLGWPLDSPIPENTVPWHNPDTTPDMKESNIPAAQAALAHAGFVDRDGDGLVEAPNGESFTVSIAFAPDTNWDAAWQSQIDEMTAAGIPYEAHPVDFNAYLAAMHQIPRNFEAISYGYSTSTNPLFLTVFSSDLLLEPYGNVWNWSNDTFDNLLDEMMDVTSAEDALDYAYELQDIIIYNSPIIVIYSNINANAIRNDKWTGWVSSPGRSIGCDNPWTLQTIKLKEDQEERDPTLGTGGTFNTLLPVEIDTQNPLMTTSVYGAYVRDEIYSSLIGELHPISKEPITSGNGLAASWTQNLVDDHWEYTFTLHENATWHDGVPVTADDVVFSYNYIVDNQVPNYVEAFDFFDKIEKVDENTVKIYSNTSSYWSWEYLRSWIILPQHIWEGVLNPATYTNPVPVGSGPFKWVERVEGEYIKVEFHPGYHRGIPGHEAPEPTTPSYVVLYLVVGVLVIVVVLLGSVWYLRKK